MFGKSEFEESPEDRGKHVTPVLRVTQVIFPGEPCSLLTKSTSDRTAGGRVDLASVVLNAPGQLYKGGVSGEFAFAPRCGKEVFGTVLYRSTSLVCFFLLGGAFEGEVCHV